MSDLPFEPLDRGDPNFEMPELGSATEGWRCWEVPSKVIRFGLAPRLYSVASTTAGYYWKPRRWSVAECHAGCKEIPGKCGCGFYSAKSFEHLKSLGYHGYDEKRDGYFRVIGVVANRPDIIEGSLGWRAESSYPVKLFVPYEAWQLAAAFKDVYGVQVALLNTLKSSYNERDQRVLKVR